MGRMKELCIEIMEANGGIPEGMTVADLAKMKELQIYQWQEYERYQEKLRLQFRESEDSREAEKIQQAREGYEEFLRKNQEKNSEQ